MTLDNAKNFAVSTVSGLYDNSATSINLVTGGGSLMPAPPFNFTWYNSSAYSNPSQDPFVEIARCTGVTGDTLTITRGAETSAQNHNITGNTYSIFAGITAKTINTDLPASFVPYVGANNNITLGSYNISTNNAIENGTSTPTATTTTTLVAGSPYYQYFTGTATQTVVMPVTSTLSLWQQWQIVNNSTGSVTVESSGANTIIVLTAGQTALITCILLTGTTATSWNYQVISGINSMSWPSGNGIPVVSGGNSWGTTLTIPLNTASGGTGVANGTNNTISFTGNYTLSITLSNNTSVVFPTSGTLINSVTTGNGVSATNTLGALLFTLGVISPTSVNGLTLAALATGFTIAGGATSKTLTVSDNTTLSTNSITFAGGEVLTLTASNNITFTTTGATSVILPLSGTLVNTAVSSLSSLSSVGTLTAGKLSTGFIIAGVTMTLGSDASYDTYYRGSSGVLTRLAIGTAGQVLAVNSGANGYAWVAQSGGGGLTVGTTSIASGNSGYVLYVNGSTLGNLAVTATPTASTISEWDANINYSANNLIDGFNTTATTAGTTVLTIASASIQVFTGSTTQIITLPTTSVPKGLQYTIINQSSGAVTVQSSGANTIVILAAGTSAQLTAVIATPTTAANWAYIYNGATAASGGSLTTTGAFPIVFTATTGITVTLPTSTDTLVGRATTDTLSNKRVTKRVLPLSANSATPAVNTDNYDVVHITGQTATITGFTMTGTPVDGDTLRISITGTTSVPFTLGSSFENSSLTAPTTTSGTARLDMGFFYNTETSKWRFEGSS